MMKKKKSNIPQFDNLLNHIAIIMDGNGTWAKRRGMPRNYGHKKGCQALINLVRYANEIRIRYLTVFAFSTENWARPQNEVDYLMKLPFEFIQDYRETFMKEQIRFQVLGSPDRVPTDIAREIRNFEEETRNNTGLRFLVAFNYGSHDEIVHAVNEIIKENIRVVNEKIIEDHLYTRDIPPVDLLIRTSGQQRISNFLLWQIAYSELYFTDTLWPDFDKNELNKALEAYQKRERRFGGIK